MTPMLTLRPSRLVADFGVPEHEDGGLGETSRTTSYPSATPSTGCGGPAAPTSTWPAAPRAAYFASRPAPSAPLGLPVAKLAGAAETIADLLLVRTSIPRVLSRRVFQLLHQSKTARQRLQLYNRVALLEREGSRRLLRSTSGSRGRGRSGRRGDQGPREPRNPAGRTHRACSYGLARWRWPWMAAISRLGAVAVMLRPDGDPAEEVRLGPVNRIVAHPDYLHLAGAVATPQRVANLTG